jgi:hypothetical protein
MARDKRPFDDKPDDFDEAYFTYRPLSNLPTPPPSSRNSSAYQSPRTGPDDGEPLKAKLLGMWFQFPVAAVIKGNGALLTRAYLSRSLDPPCQPHSHFGIAHNPVRTTRPSDPRPCLPPPRDNRPGRLYPRLPYRKIRPDLATAMSPPPHQRERGLETTHATGRLAA